MSTVIIENLESLVPQGSKLRGNHFIVKCPYCESNLDYHKEKLYILKDYSAGFCFRCKSKYHAEDRSWERRLSFGELYSRSDSSGLKKIVLPKYEDIRLYTEALMSNSVLEEWLYEKNPYLVPKEYGIRFLRNSILFPFFYFDQFIYYTRRFVDKEHEDAGKKYFNLPDIERPVYITGDYTSSKAILVEGVRDAIAVSIMIPDVLVIGCQGVYLSEYQLNMINTLLIDQFYVWLDDPPECQDMIDALTPKLLSYQSIRYFHHTTLPMGYYKLYPKSKQDPEDYLREVGLDEAKKLLRSDLILNNRFNLKLNKRDTDEKELTLKDRLLIGRRNDNKRYK